MFENDRYHRNRKKEKIAGSAGLAKKSEQSAGTDITKAINLSEGIIDISVLLMWWPGKKRCKQMAMLQKESDSQIQQKEKDQFRSQ
jgi:hypothetical protein